MSNRSVESASDACRTILRFMREYDKDGYYQRDICEALLEDLCFKATGIDTTARGAFLTEALYHVAPQRIRELFSDKSFDAQTLLNLEDHARIHRNVGIITVIPPELKATLYALDRERDDEPDFNHGPYRYWTGDIPSTIGNSLPHTYVLSMVGKPRNVPCALAVGNMMTHYNVDLLVLIGIAAGPKSKRKLGDVVISNAVYDYEHVRSELINGTIIEKPRPEFFLVEDSIENDVVVSNSLILIKNSLFTSS